MKSDEVSRRFVVGALGVGAAGVAASAAVGGIGVGETSRVPLVGPARAASKARPPVAEAPELAQAHKLVAPLSPGDRLARWTLEQILPVEGGAASVILKDASGGRFQLDICKRDESASAPVGPGRSDLFEVFLANSGNGSKATFEEHGLAAMALAEVIRGNEQRVDRTAFATQAQRAADARLHVT